MAVNGINNIANSYWSSTYVQNQIAKQEAQSVVTTAANRRDSYYFIENEPETDTAVLDYFKSKSGDYEVFAEKDGDSLQKILDLLRSRRGNSFILIDPKFYKRLASDPELAEKYACEIEDMIKADKQFEQQAKRQGKTVVSRGWYIDKDGFVNGWSITKTEPKKKGFLETMRENNEKLRLKKKKKEKEQKDLERKRSQRKEEKLRLEGKKRAAAKERLRRSKIKRVSVYELKDLYKTKRQQSGGSVSISVSRTNPMDTKA